MILPVSLMAIDYVYWDSMCFIYRIGRKTEYITALEEITRRAENNEIMLVILPNSNKKLKDKLEEVKQ